MSAHVWCVPCRDESDRLLAMHRAVAAEGARSTLAESAHLATQARVAREMVVVALRMLARADQLKATTDDERAAVRLAEFFVGQPAGNRRVLDPREGDYVETVVETFQPLLFDSLDPVPARPANTGETHHASRAEGASA